MLAGPPAAALAAAARKTLEAVIAQYPGTEQAKTAQSRLKTMH